MEGSWKEGMRGQLFGKGLVALCTCPNVPFRVRSRNLRFVVQSERRKFKGHFIPADSVTGGSALLMRFLLLLQSVVDERGFDARDVVEPVLISCVPLQAQTNARYHVAYLFRREMKVFCARMLDESCILRTGGDLPSKRGRQDELRWRGAWVRGC